MDQPSPADCYTPASPLVAARVLEASRSVRYDALLELIDQLQRRRSIDALARAAASRWKHCASVHNWRLLAVSGTQCALIVVDGPQVQVSQLPLDALPAYDAALWQRRTPRQLDAAALAAERDRLPPELAVPEGVALGVWPVQQGQTSLGLLSVLGIDQPFDAMDRKFIQLVAVAMATRIVAILTEERLQAELLAAERQAMEQRQAAILGRLVNGVAHELNTPLGVQLSACGALEEMLADAAPDDADARETVQLIEQQARRSARIVRRLKQVSAAAQSNPRVPTALADEIRAIAEQHAELDIEFGALDALTLTLDRSALATVLGELLDNVQAHGAPPDGRAQARIETAREGGALLLRVIDQGPGLPARQAALLFEPFHTTRQSQGHIGIGGYIAHNVAKEALNARLELQTAPGRTCVTLHLPLPPGLCAP